MPSREEELKEARTTILLLQEELERLSQPPYLSATVLGVGEKTARLAVDGAGFCETPLPQGAHLKRGDRVVLSKQNFALIGPSEFPIAGGPLAVVDEVNGDRIRIQSEGSSRLVFSAVEGLKAGDEVLLDHTGSLLVEKIAGQKTKYSLEDIPHAPWEEIGGLEGIIDQIKREIEDPFRHREIYARYGRKPVKGILLYGPPGCGKTMIGKSIAYSLAQIVRQEGGEDHGHFIRVNGPEILDKYVGNTEANIRRIYGAAREISNGAPVVVFIDEAESLLKTRGTGISTDVYDSIVPQFLAEMNGMNDEGNVITVLATNREDVIDPAVLRNERIDRKIKVPRPDEHGAQEIIALYLKEKPLGEGIKGKSVEEVADQLVRDIYSPSLIVYNLTSPQQGVVGKFTARNFVSGAMLRGIIDRACGYAIERELSQGSPGVSYADLQQATHQELLDQSYLTQSLVREDWEDVFGAQGRNYQAATTRGILVLENMLVKAGENLSSKQN